MRQRVGLLPFPKLAPAAFLDFHAEFRSGRFNAPPGLVAVLVCDTLHLVETSDGISYMRGVFQGLLALLRKGKALTRHFVTGFSVQSGHG